MANRLYRIEEGKKLAGVCVGIAKYFDIDPVIVRLIWVIAVLCFGVGILAYIIAALIIPKQEVITY